MRLPLIWLLPAWLSLGMAGREGPSTSTKSSALLVDASPASKDEERGDEKVDAAAVTPRHGVRKGFHDEPPPLPPPPPPLGDVKLPSPAAPAAEPLPSGSIPLGDVNRDDGTDGRLLLLPPPPLLLLLLLSDRAPARAAAAALSLPS